MSKKMLLQEVNKIPVELGKAIVERQCKYEDVIYGNDSKICKGCFRKPWEQGKIGKCI